MRFCEGKYPKYLPKMAYFGHFFFGGGSEGKQNLRLRGEMSLCPLDAATDDIQPEIQVPPGVKVDYDYREKNLENSVGPSTEFPVSVFSTFNRRDLNFRDP